MYIGNNPIARGENLVIQELEKELLIYDLKTNKALCLNETLAMVFQLCDGTKSVAEISDLMSKKFKILISEDIVRLSITELKKANLLENSREFVGTFAGLSRREIVKKIGLTSMVALPLVTSIIAPSAAVAQSGCTLLPPGAIYSQVCSNQNSVCNQFNHVCCSGLLNASTAAPCPLNPDRMIACVCA